MMDMHPPCARRVQIWDAETPRRTPAWKDEIATGLPVIKSNSTGLAAGYTSMLALPIHRGSALAFVAAWNL